MRLICVGGVSSCCGKTSVVCLLLRAFPGWVAVKVTPSRLEEACPLGDDCGACQSPDGGYAVVIDENILRQPGKDTARFLEAGASRVAWVRALPELLPIALDQALGRLSDAPGVIVESTTAIPLLDGLHVLVARRGASGMKESARRCAGHADMLAVNIDASSLPDSDLDEAGQYAGLKPCRVTPMCAVLPPEHPSNREFIRLAGHALQSR